MVNIRTYETELFKYIDALFLKNGKDVKKTKGYINAKVM